MFLDKVEEVHKNDKGSYLLRLLSKLHYLKY